jgi:Ca2+/Na+ antiporter
MLGRAYGTCVAMIVFLTTCMVSLIAIIVWKIHPLLVFPIFISFACLDGLYLSSALTKIPNGAWFTLMVALLLTFLVYIWRFGKDQQEEVPDPNARLKWGDPRLLTLQGRYSCFPLCLIPPLTPRSAFRSRDFRREGRRAI